MNQLNVKPRSLPITAWSKKDQPREKLKEFGRNSLTNAELLAIILGSGTKDISALELAKSILMSCNDNLLSLGQFSLHQLQQFSGVGPAKAITLSAALELGLRRQASSHSNRIKITQSIHAFNALLSTLSDLAYEVFVALVLNRCNEVIGMVRVSTGGVSSTVVDTKKLFRKVLEYERGTSIILGHNHPSGNLKPSSEDIRITKQIVQASQLIGLQVLDHIIIANDDYTSFADEGLIH